jgi:hypothetical protein
MSLQNWLQIGHLIDHQATIAEVRNLLGVVDRELADAGVAGLTDPAALQARPARQRLRATGGLPT